MFNESLRHNYDLDGNSIVFDIGGYKGEWSKIIYDKYKSRIYCFEPVFTIVDPNIQVLKHALGGSTRTETFYINNDGTGIYSKVGGDIIVSIVDIMDIVKEFDHIDLMKINIEGMEYELLNRLLDCDWVKNITDIQVQFHYVTVESDKDMFLIQKRLGETHYPTYQFRYVWENWRLK